MFAPVVLVAAWLVFWLVDASNKSGKTPRGLSIEAPDISIDIGGMSEDDVTTVVVDLAERYQQTPVEVVTPSQAIPLTAADIGLAVDVEATVAAIMDLEGSGGNPFGWTASFFESSESGLLFTLSADPQQITELEDRLRKEPINPSIIFHNGSFQVAAGVQGEIVNLNSALPRLLEAAQQGESPLTSEADVRLIPPETPDEAVAAAADWINQRTAQGLLVTVEEVTKRVQPAQLRSWLTLQGAGEQWTYDIDRQRVQDDLAELFVEVATVASEPVVTVIDDVPVLVSEVPALICCEEDASRKVLLALETELPAVELALRESDEMNDQSWLIERGIVELVGRFTTEYQPGQSRVVNIHRIAELIQGAVVYPGETFSVNDFVGERTEERGFVSGGVINLGVYTKDVGGGISQFITTLFTAAFNAGMEFPFYQSHTLDIPRYREGVDATISWPAPDFQFYNPHPYAVLLWPTVTDSSVTVSLYSTAHAEVEWTNRYDVARKFCTMRVTERSRTYIDGRVLTDSVNALYQPREGINCDGVCISPVIPLDADGDGVAEVDDRGLPGACVAPEDCAGSQAPVDTNEDGTPDLCTVAPPGDDGSPSEPAPDGALGQGSEPQSGQSQTLDPEQGT